jgi:hypothetical protein
MNRKVLLISLAIVSATPLIAFGFSQAAGRPDVTRHEANFLGSAVNFHIEWQSLNPVTLVKISMPGVEEEIKVDPYDNKRNRDGYAGEVDVTLDLSSAPGKFFTYIVQLEDELRIKSEPVTGRVKISSSQQQPAAAPQTQQPSMPINIQQNISQPQTTAQVVGSVIVTIAPDSVNGVGAMWRVDNGQWQKSGDTISNLSVGTHTIDFSEVTNWTRPASQQLVIQGGSPAMAMGIYTPR